jgi:DNA-binding transcriptional MerR regulator
MSDLSATITTELEGGVSQARLAELAGISASTLRSYEKAGLIPSRSSDGKKSYGAAALERLEFIKNRKAEGAKLEDITLELLSEQRSPEEMMAEVGRLRALLEESQGKLKALSQQVQDRVIARRDEMRETRDELQAIEDLRASNIRRSAQVERRAVALKHNLEYRRAGSSGLRITLPQGSKKKR